MRENLYSNFANNKGTYQPAHLRRLISAFIISFLESIIFELATSKLSIFSLVSVAEETGLSRTLSETPKTGFVTSASKRATTQDFQRCGMCNQQRLRPACTYAQSDQSLYLSLEYSMILKLLTDQNLAFLNLKGLCKGSSESSLVKMPHCWKSHVTAQTITEPRHEKHNTKDVRHEKSPNSLGIRSA